MPSQRKTRAPAGASALTGRETEEELERIFAILRRAKLTMWAAEGQEGNFAIRLWTPGAERVYGYTRDEALGSSYIDLIVNPAERQQAIDDHMRMVDNDEEYEWDWAADDLAKDGTTRTVLTNCFPIWDEDLGKSLLAEIAVDVSRKEQASRKLRQLQAETMSKEYKAANMRWMAAVEGIYSSIAKLSGGESTSGPIAAPAASHAVRTIVDGEPAVRLWLRTMDGPVLADGSSALSSKAAVDELEAFKALTETSSPEAVFIDSHDRNAEFARGRRRGKGPAAAVIPIQFAFELRGVLTIHFAEERRITESERSALSQLGLHLGVALAMEELSREQLR